MRKEELINQLEKDLKKPVKISQKDLVIFDFFFKMQESAKNYFSDSENGLSTAQYLVKKYDPNYPWSKNAFDPWDVFFYGTDEIYLNNKEKSMFDLLKNFINKKPIKTYEDYTKRDIKNARTVSREKYFFQLSKEFKKNPEEEKIIEFLNLIPGDPIQETCLPCDKPGDFDRYYKKFLNNKN